MKILVSIEQDIPAGLFCDGRSKCCRLETDKHNQVFCSLFNRFVFLDKNGRTIKCDECLCATVDALQKEP